MSREKGQSYWHHILTETEKQALTGDPGPLPAVVDTVIVGSGAAGLGAAMQMTGRVLVLEAEARLADGASGCNGGFEIADYYAGDLVPQLPPPTGQIMMDALRDSTAMIDQIATAAPSLGIDTQRQQRGGLELAGPDDHTGTHHPDNGHFNPLALRAAQIMAIRQREKTHFACHQPVHKLSHQGEGFVVTLANHQTITARHVILAAAGGNQAILANSPLPVDFVTPRRGKTLPVSTCAIATTPIPDAVLAGLSVWERQRLSLPCHTEQEPSDWFVRLQNGVLVYGCAAYIPDGWFQPDVDYILGRIKLFLPGIYQAIQAKEIDITCFWDGVQHFTTRGIPLIQAAAFGQNRLVVAGAFTGVGNIPAQSAGIIAARIVEQQIDARHFAPDITTAQPPFLGWRLGIDRALHGTGLALVQLLPGGGRLVAAYRAFYHHPTCWGGLRRAIAEIFRP